jgi:hypothetical protein
MKNTRKKEKSNLFDIYVGVDKSSTERNVNDLYETSPLATYALHKFTEIPKNVVEPCAGRGNISIELQRLGYNVLSMDLNSYENTLVDIDIGNDVNFHFRQDGYDALITNPPYFEDLPRKIAEKGVSQYDYTALFVRLTFLEGKKRNSLFTENKPSDIIFLSDRIRFGAAGISEAIEKKEQLGGMISYVWVVWSKKAKHENTRCHWVILENLYDEWRTNYDKWKLKDAT